MDAAPATAPGQAPPLILVGDDERDVGRSLAELLEVLGYATEVVESANDALRRAVRRRFHAVISDYRMPVMDGRSLLGKIVAADPSLSGRCILATGDTLGAERDGDADAAAGPILLPKPFSRADVRAALDRMRASQ